MTDLDTANVIFCALGIAGAWLLALEWRSRMVAAEQEAREARALADRCRDRLCEVLPRAMAVDQLWADREACLASLRECDAREEAAALASEERQP